jgi:hypothetical protein
MKKRYLPFYSLGNSVSKCSIKSPTEFLNYGKQISEYHQVEAYFSQFDESQHIKKQKYDNK